MATSKKLSQLPVGTSTTGKSLLMADNSTGAAQLIDAQVFTPPLISPFCLNPSHVQTVDLTALDPATWYCVSFLTQTPSHDGDTPPNRVVASLISSTKSAVADIVIMGNACAVLAKYGTGIGSDPFPLAQSTAGKYPKLRLLGGNSYSLRQSIDKNATVYMTAGDNTTLNPTASAVPLPNGIIINSVS